MKREDLRVTKTTKMIKETFLKQICEKPLHKLTVTGLAREAQINKGTFYLHFDDLYDLYENVLQEIVLAMADKFDPYPKFFSDPEAFVREFLFSQVEPPSKEELAIFKKENLCFSAQYPTMFVDAFRNKLYQAGPLQPCRENDAKLEYLINGMLALLIKPGLLQTNQPEGDRVAIHFLAGSVRQLFPALYN